MATAKRVAPEPPPVEIQLTLSEEEAVTLSNVCARISGSQTSPRRHTDAIASALDSLGRDYRLRTAHDNIRGEIGFAG